MSAEQHKMLYLINVNQVTYCLGESKDMRDKYHFDFFCNDMQLMNDGTYNNSRKLKSLYQIGVAELRCVRKLPNGIRMQNFYITCS